MKTNIKLFGALAVAIAAASVPATASAQEKVTGWGNFKLYLDPGHSGHENQGLWTYSEAEKVLDIALNIKNMLETYTDMPAENLKLCRYNETDVVSLEERSDEANAWGADFYYSIHSDAGATYNATVLLFGGWRNNGVEIEKTPNGGKAYGEILDPNLSGVMRVPSRGNWYDRCFYDRAPQTHANQYPYLSVNRRSNMPSLLSEGAYHTIAYQQSRNMNTQYRRLEAFAAFQSLLKYHGMDVPAQTFLHGEIANSENGQFINGAVVTVMDGDTEVATYTTDSYESLFHKYSKNPNLIHNGLYTFEGLEAGKTYTVKIEAEGFTPVTKEVTVKAGGEHSADFVTFLDAEMENILPAKVDAISITNPEDVSPAYPVTITFSRNMIRETVEEAFSVNNKGEIGLKWINDYTLELDLSKLLPLWDYTITIDGSIAKNSQTNQYFDGDGDGEPGGDWVYTFVMAEPDLEAPEVVTTYPAIDGEVQYATQFPIRIEYNEEINWNEDKNGECVAVMDKDRNVYPGKVKHDVIGGKSVIHFFPNEPLPLDRTFLVTVSPGLSDMLGNTTTEPFNFRFMTEYRQPVSFVEVLPVNDNTNFWNPGGSGSTKGIDKDNSVVGKWNQNPFSATGTSMEMYYIFDEFTSDSEWFIREYNSNVSTNIQDMHQVLTYWIFSDGSLNEANLMVRVNGSGIKKRGDNMLLDFRGWNLFVWDLQNDDYKHFTGTEDLYTASQWRFDSFTLEHFLPEIGEEDEVEPAWIGSIGYHQFAMSKWGEGERQAALNDIDENAGATEVADNVDALAIAVGQDLLTIRTDAEIVSASVYAADGMKVAMANGRGNVATAAIGNLANGIYIVKVLTADGMHTAKFVK